MFVDLDCGRCSAYAKVVRYYFVPVAMHGHDPSKKYNSKTLLLHLSRRFGFFAGQIFFSLTKFIKY
jgi:hypothetical protein